MTDARESFHYREFLIMLERLNAGEPEELVALDYGGSVDAVAAIATVAEELALLREAVEHAGDVYTPSVGLGASLLRLELFRERQL